MIIGKLIDRSKEYERKMRIMERRIKELEKQTNSTSLIQPSFEDISFGGYVNCTAINMVDQADPTSPSGINQGDGTVEHDMDASSKKECYLQLSEPSTIGALNIAFSTTPDMTWDVAGDIGGGVPGRISGVITIISIGFLISTWDPTDLYWNNKPAPTITRDYEYIFTKRDLGRLIVSQDMSFRLGWEEDELSVLVKPSIVGCTGFSIELSGSITAPGSSNRIAQAVASIAGTSDPATISAGSSSFGLREI